MSNKTEFFYNKFSCFYPLVDVFLRPQKNVLFREINLLPEGDLLEIGVGNGAHLHHYKKHTITGIDISASMLKVASKQCPGAVKLAQMDGKALIYDDERFDYIVLSHVIAVVDDPEQVLKEVFRVLKPRGKVFILNHFTPDNWFRHIDRAFSVVSKLFHFKSVFCIHEIATIRKFTLLKEVCFGSASYFKLLVFQKSEK